MTLGGSKFCGCFLGITLQEMFFCSNVLIVFKLCPLVKGRLRQRDRSIIHILIH